MKRQQMSHHAENGHSHQNGVSHDVPSAEVCAPTLVPSASTHSFLNTFFTRTIMPLFLMAFSPNLVILLWYTATRCDGSFLKLFTILTNDGIVSGVWKIWMDINIASALSVWVIVAYMVWALFLMLVVPGPRVEGPVTPKGNVPVYVDNGFSCYVITIAAFCFLTFVLKRFYGISPTIIYDHFDEFLGTLTVYSHLLCFALHAKGLLWPSSTDSGTTGRLIFDYYWGTELYPRIFGVDIKVFTNCRCGMTVWALLVLIFGLKSYELHGFVDSMFVSAALQMVYFTKFFWWESGYMRTIDIMLDRAGFYICWGCLCYIPGLYASVSMYLVNHPVHLGTITSTLLLASGIACIIINYLADKQKLDVRRANGNCQVWGRPAEVIRAKYLLESGEERESILLVSGWWGISRHFHYLPELTFAFLWSVPGLFENVLVYSYFIWLLLLLTHRTFRDDTKCSKKYGKYWREYCARVRYRMIPYIF